MSEWGDSRGPPHEQMTYALKNNHGVAKGAAICHEPVKCSLELYHAVWRSHLSIVTWISQQLTRTRTLVQLPQAAASANINAVLEQKEIVAEH